MSEAQHTPKRTPAENQSSDVSRETVDLIEIMDRSLPKAPDPPEVDKATETPPQGETTPPPEEGAPTSPPGKNKPTSFYVYLVILFGAAFMMLLLAYFVQKRDNETAITDLRNTMNLSRGELLERIEGLEEENAQLQAELEGQKDRADRAELENERLSQALSDSNTLNGEEAIKARAAECLWYLDQFMQAKDYPMAAAVLYFSANNYRYLYGNNPAQLEQCREYRQELVDRGYLAELPSMLDSQSSPTLFFPQQWDPSKSEDMAAMCILWIALDACFINGAGEPAAQFLYLYPLADPSTGYQERVQQLASDFTLRQFQDLKDALVEIGALAVAEDGTMTRGPGVFTDVLYGLPFVPPGQTVELPGQTNGN